LRAAAAVAAVCSNPCSVKKMCRWHIFSVSSSAMLTRSQSVRAQAFHPVRVAGIFILKWIPDMVSSRKS